MTVTIANIPRPDKATIAAAIGENLTARQQQGPAEPALDAYIAELTDLASRLKLHVTGDVTADAARAVRLAKAEIADDEVDALYRHLFYFFDVEALRRTGTAAVIAAALRDAAFPDGLAHVDERVVDENQYCREAHTVLTAPEHAADLASLKVPAGWVADFGAAIAASDAAIEEVVGARGDKTDHVAAGRDAEGDWIDLMVRLRRYVASRAKRTDAARIAEGKALLAPLLDAMKKLRADAAARATIKKNKAAGDAPAAPAAPAGGSSTPATP